MQLRKSRIKTCRLNLKTTQKFKSWLAGLIDGEGNFYFKETSTCQIRIVLEERDKFVLDYIQENIGGFLFYRKPQKSWELHWKPQWEWRVSSKIDCLKFTEWILPELILKKNTANDFYLRVLNSVPKGVLI